MKLVDTAVARPVTMWMFTLGIMLFGLVAMGRLAVNLLPDLSYPTLTIRTEYAGAAPAEVEQLVSKPIEEAVGIVKGIRKVHSVSRAGRSDVIMEFEWGSDMDLAGLEVREKIDVLYLPLDVKKPLLLRFNPNLDPVVRLALSRDEKQDLTPAQLVSLRTFAEEDLRRRLESLAGVAAVRPDGGLTQEIQILIDNEKLSQLKLDISTINQRLKEQNINQAGGRLETGSHDYLVRTINQFANLDQIRNLYIAKVGESQIRLSDIAEIRDSFVDRQSITYVHGKEAIEIAIYKEGDANTVQVAKTVTAKLEDLQKNLPAGYQLTLVYDQSTFIKQAIDEVKSAAFEGGILAMIVLYLFLRNVWTTLVISISIPLSVIATFNLMYAQDISLNIMSLGGIALAIGMLVDNAIVVLENIARYKEQGMAPMEAAKKGASEVAMAITASTLTTVAVFFPLVFVEGVAGQLFKDQALTVTYALLASLLVALTLIPAMAARERTTSAAAITSDTQAAKLSIKPSRWYLWPLVPFHLLYLAVRFVFLGLFTVFTILFRAVAKGLSFVFNPLLNIVQAFLRALESGYRAVLTAALRAKALVLAATIGLTALIYSLIPGLGFDVIPSMSQGEFYVEVQLPVGSAIERTDKVLKQLADVASLQPEIDRSYAQAGTGQQMTVDPNVGGSHWGRLNIILKDSATKADEERLIQLFRDAVSTMPDLSAKIDRPELFSFSTPLEIELSGHDLTSLKATSDQLAKALAANDRFTDIKSSLRSGQPEITLHFHHDRLSQLGLTAADVSKRVANYIGGEVAGQYSINDRKVDIRVRLAENFRNSEQQLSQIIINPNSEKPLPLSAVADIKREVGPSEITRIGQQRVALVSANLAYGDLEQATAAAKAVLAQLTLPYGVGATIVGQSEEMERSFNSLMMALLLAVFLVYLVMASQFENLLQPLLILFTVPLAGAGAVLGLWLTGTRVSVIVFIGLIMLAGIVVNNAIVLIDRINQLRDEGMAVSDAIVEAGATRLRPVLMTTLTTVLGLLPMVLGSSDGAEIRAPMAITVIWGLSLSTLLTLVFIPVLYRLTARDVPAAKE
ncbi:efflux RND transporter permease subunit [Rheinheimera tangshanensis]|uniref:Efflux RND transporter permease subunit n=1 Tax=Rheinheimera tangshanensis TaxID=400153 RepID=A0A5C8M231_9GAMM|nr:efflux RND transporter permease subunit [Rheinheimera tangshanensis]TXK81742.1 efflux RND transporter permease subunit [Rheinheimera tangshanensis]GGM55539.1 acriflavin resistance protein [Rheinheimera tangshanensis]